MTFMLTFVQRGYAEALVFQQNQTSLHLYTVTQNLHHTQSCLGGTAAPGYISTPRMATSISSGKQSHAFGMNAWTGSVCEIGANMPISNSQVGADGSLAVRKAIGGGSGGHWTGPDNTPLGDTPYWLFAVLIIGYGVYRKRRMRKQTA